MKKIMLALLLMLSMAGGFAQTPKKDTTKKASSGPLKKDGTADMRYKSNKESKTTGPKKKDGTPDMRYKKNKKDSL